MFRSKLTALAGAIIVLLALVAAGCGGSSKKAATTTGSWTTSADRVRLGATTSTAVNLVIDDARLNPGVMPGPSP